MSRYTLLLGGNEGDVAATFAKAIEQIAELGELVRSTSSYTSKAWGFASADFLNMAVEVESVLQPEVMLDELQRIECALGRTTKSYNGQYAARPIDIDILYCNRLVIDTPRLSIPHLLIAQRRFVLVPLMELCPDFVDPRTSKTIRQMLAEVGND